MFVKFFPVSRLKVGVCALTVLSFLTLSESAHARCSTRVADVLIKARYQGCNPKAMLSYLYSDLVTPFSFTCAKRLRETCRKENCADPKTPEEEQRCLSRYAEVLNACPDEIEGAAKMARCKDTKVWAVNLPTKNQRGTLRTIPATEPGNSTAPVSAVALPTANTSVSVAAPITPATTGAVTGPAPILVAPGPVLAPLAPAPVLAPATATAPAVEVAAPAVVAPAAVTTTAPMALPPSAPTTVYRPIMTAPVAPTPAPNPAVNPPTQTQFVPIHRQGRIRITTPPRTLIYRASQSSPAHP